MNDDRQYETIRVHVEDNVCFIRISRPESNNTINDTLVEEMRIALDLCEPAVNIVVLEGLPEVFCLGADIVALRQSGEREPRTRLPDPAPLYELWLQLSNSPFVAVAHVRGRANAGGIGFVAACDIVLCDERAVFSLSELLFGLLPACVLPFLIRRIGVAKANYLTLLTKPISAKQALEWGLVDACDPNSDDLLRKHLLRLRVLSKAGIARYKRYRQTLDDTLVKAKPAALQANREAFSDKDNLAMIDRYLRTGEFPWAGD